MAFSPEDIVGSMFKCDYGNPSSGECDNVPTNTAAYPAHKILHDYDYFPNSSRSRAVRGGGGKSKGKKKKKNNKGRSKPKAVSFGEFSYDEFSSEDGSLDEAFPVDEFSPENGTIHRECVTCGLKFKNPAMLIDDHFRASSVDTDMYMSGLIHYCPPAVNVRTDSVVPASCGQNCVGDSTANEVFPCLLCDEIPPSRTLLNHHMRLAHHKCLRCKVQFESETELLEHFAVSKQHKFCLTCSLNFLCEEELENHDKTHHSDTLLPRIEGEMKSGDSSIITTAGPYRCQFCRKEIRSYTTVEKLESHLQRHHIRCFPCKREFATKNSLSTHLQMHSSHHYCHFCDTDFVYAEALNRHTSICISRSQLAPCANGAAPNVTAHNIEQAFNTVIKIDLNTVIKTGKKETNCRTGPSKERIHLDMSKLETVDGDEEDIHDSDAVPVFKEAPVPVSGDVPVDAREKDLSGTAGKQVPETLSKVALGSSETITISGTVITQAPVLVSAETPAFQRGRDLSSDSDKQYPEPVSVEVPSSQQGADLSGAAVRGDDRFTCSACGENARSGVALNEHYATTHSRCLLCNIQFKSQTDLHCHFSNSKVHRQKFCDICKICFSSTAGLTDHNAASHFPRSKDIPEELFRCDVCTWVPSFHTEEKLEVHLQCEHLRCFPCKREFCDMKSLCKHLTQSSTHNYCAGCETNFVSPQALSSHGCPGLPWKVTRLYQTSQCIPKDPSKMEGIRPVELYYDYIDGCPVLEEYDCHVCWESFDTEEDKNWHAYDNHRWCKECDEQLTSARAFHEHQLTVHNWCFECDDHFISPESLGKHWRLSRSDRYVTTKNFMCDKCSILIGPFETEELLVKHLHTKNCEKE